MKKIMSVFLISVLFFSQLYISAKAEGPELSASSAILIDAESGAVLYEKNAEETMLIASTTKVMTALVVLDNCDIEEEVYIEREYVGIEGSSIYLRAGETVTVRELLYGLILNSGNDAAVALACHTAGSVEDFAQLMNEKAAELKLTGSSFKNPHGLDEEGHYSTARDLAYIMRAAMDNEHFAEISSTRSISIGERTFYNHNKLLTMYDGCIAGKTGYTKKAGRSLISCAERDGQRYICVTINAPDDWNDHSAIYDWAFSVYEKVTVVDSSMTYFNVPVISGEQGTVALVPERDLVLLAKDGDEIKIELQVPRFVYAQVTAGQATGSMVISLNGERVAKIQLVNAETIPRDESVKLTFWEKIRRGLHFSTKYGYHGPVV